jgi:hypothetical protein
MTHTSDASDHDEHPRGHDGRVGHDDDRAETPRETKATLGETTATLGKPRRGDTGAAEAQRAAIVFTARERSREERPTGAFPAETGANGASGWREPEAETTNVEDGDGDAAGTMTILRTRR